MGNHQPGGFQYYLVRQVVVEMVLGQCLVWSDTHPIQLLPVISARAIAFPKKFQKEFFYLAGDSSIPGAF